MNTFKKGLRDCLVLGSLAFLSTAQLANANVCSKDGDEPYLIKVTQVSSGQFKLELCEAKNSDSCKPIGNKSSYKLDDIKSAAYGEYGKGLGVFLVDVVLTGVVGVVGVGVATVTVPELMLGSALAGPFFASNVALAAIGTASAGLVASATTLIEPLNPMNYKRAGDLYLKTAVATTDCTYLPEGQGILQYSRIIAKGLDDRPNMSSVFTSNATKILEQSDAGTQQFASDAGVNQSSIAR